MGKVYKHPTVKLIIGFIFKDEGSFKKSAILLKRKFGPFDFESQLINFIPTDYYEAEFGKVLKRKFLSFKMLLPPQDLAKIKIYTNSLEQKLSKGNKRTINIDPGYLDLGKLVLATTKDHSHRIYLNKGIFGEVTLFYENKSFRPWNWTYPDYRTDEYITIFNQIREVYYGQIKQKCTHHT